MKDYASETNPWKSAAPTVAGLYEVRMRARAWGLRPLDVKRAKIVRIDLTDRTFDAGAFGGPIDMPVWEWRGPICAPSHLPEEIA